MKGGLLSSPILLLLERVDGMRLLTSPGDGSGAVFSSSLRSQLRTLVSPASPTSPTAKNGHSNGHGDLPMPLSTARRKWQARSSPEQLRRRGMHIGAVMLGIATLWLLKTLLGKLLPEDPYAHHVEPYVEPNQNSTVPWSTALLLPQKVRSIHPNWHGRLSTRSRSSLAVHHVPSHPHPMVLPPNSPASSELLFGWTTSADRVILHAQLWKPLLNDGSPCRIVLPPRDRKHLQAVIRDLKKYDLSCEITVSDEQNYKNRVLRGLGDLHDSAVKVNAKWIIISDDDTVFLERAMLQRLLAAHDPKQDVLIGALTEARLHQEWFPGIAFGGGGIVISAPFAGKIAAALPTCVNVIDTKVSGGDGMISHCAAYIRNASLADTITYHPGLHQMDVWDEASGHFQSGQQFISIHHAVHGWYRIFPRYDHHSIFWRDTDISAVRLLQDAAALLGGDNLFRRFVFRDGYAMITLGYSITVYHEPLAPWDLRRLESNHYLRKEIAQRPLIPEGRPWWSTESDFKTTYYLSRIRSLNRHQVEMIYSNWAAQSIRLIWDTSNGQ